MTPDERHGRLLRVFCRWLCATNSADDATRESIASLARRVDDGGLTASEQRSCLEQLDDILLSEIDRRHR